MFGSFGKRNSTEPPQDVRRTERLGSVADKLGDRIQTHVQAATALATELERTVSEMLERHDDLRGKSNERRY